MEKGRLIPFDSDSAREVLAGSVCVFGVFDGFHIGHRFIVDSAAQAAESRRLAILTFDTDPDELFHPASLRKLMTNGDRLRTLCESGADAVIALPFTREFAAKSPRAFIEEVLAPGVPSQMHVGLDIRFGSRAAGTVETLREWGECSGMRVFAHDLFEKGGQPVTATRIRALLEECRLDEANELLGRSYTVSGTVEAGRGEGADMGFKTANLSIPDPFRVLGDGVYAAYAHIGGSRYKAAVSMGVPPTFADRATHNCEAHILDFDGNLYGQSLTLEFVEFLRPMMAFPSLDELVATVMGNIDWVRNNL